MRHTYNGTDVDGWLPTAFYEGREDATSGSFKRFEQLYRYPRYKQALYRIGWTVGRVFGGGE